VFINKVLQGCITFSFFLKKNLVYKNQGQEPIHQKYKANESMSKTQPKEQKKANNQHKIK
jgi:hypothetical protein